MADHRQSLARFLAVAVAGLGVDAAATFLVRLGIGLSLTASGAIGYLAGAIVVFMAHEFWTFPDADKSLRGLPRRLLLYAASQGLGFVVRVAALAGLGIALAVAPFSDILVFCGAVALSFVVNFLVSRFVVFKKKR